MNTRDFTNFNFEGNTELLLKNKYKHLAILGSRNVIDYTKIHLIDLVESISNLGDLVIVSGGMYGVDLFALNLAIKLDIPVVVFLPCGIGAYKKSSLFRGLNLKNSSKYLLISRYDTDFTIRKYTLLERNRDIVDLSDVILIAQSSNKSGSIYSGNYSLKSKKITYCFPFSLDMMQFQGNNTLIAKGARIYLDAEELSVSLGFKISNKIDLREISKQFPLTKEEISKKFDGVDMLSLEKSLLEAVLKREIFYSDGRYYFYD